MLFLGTELMSLAERQRSSRRHMKDFCPAWPNPTSAVKRDNGVSNSVWKVACRHRKNARARDSDCILMILNYNDALPNRFFRR
jgi:hypothetical protein